ncbi:MAG: helix-turn-helix domain-containing protein [Thermomicrobiales bacterium]
MDIRKRLGDNVRRLRTDKGWSQEDYADRAGIHRTYVSDIERGARNPTITVIEKLAKPFGVNAGSLLNGRNAPGSTEPNQCLRGGDKQSEILSSGRQRVEL